MGSSDSLTSRTYAGHGHHVASKSRSFSRAIVERRRSSYDGTTDKASQGHQPTEHAENYKIPSSPDHRNLDHDLRGIGSQFAVESGGHKGR
ncbi:Uu.00g144630.m01.CDS01 [Anthostomella pinea]|uniref:Uu.00g144630.m01.CDS01 n=1 Tax=Anthostomella pinea TaxID=933095 RepID=A0AAI8YLR6_9PEZI|nr:Uu.00g144630.m01.CDS01 [Anthostomella pinea]